jgi:hypothetical protein
MARWKFMTSHAHVLACIAADPKSRLRDIAVETDLTERYVHHIVDDLEEAGYINRERLRGRNQYEVKFGEPLRDPSAEKHSVRDLLALLARDESLNGGRRRASQRSRSGRRPD